MDQARLIEEFPKAYYYVGHDEMIEPFINVSQVSDQRLSALAYEAQTRFQEAKRRRKYLKSFGPKVGPVFYRLSNVRLARKLGQSLLRSQLWKSLHGDGRLGQVGEYNLREEFSQKWR
jgi:hypothetical protein